jgi:hypothetical protein
VETLAVGEVPPIEWEHLWEVEEQEKAAEVGQLVEGALKKEEVVVLAVRRVPMVCVVQVAAVAFYQLEEEVLSSMLKMQALG